MPVKPPVYDPPFNILRCSHVIYGVTDLAASRAFYVDTLGLIVTEETKDRLYLRGTEERNHHSIELRQTGDPLCYALGLKVASDKDLDLAKVWFEKRGLPAEFRGWAMRFFKLQTGTVTHHVEVTTLDAWLRGQLGFRGVIVSEQDIDMAGTGNKVQGAIISQNNINLNQQQAANDTTSTIGGNAMVVFNSCAVAGVMQALNPDSTEVPTAAFASTFNWFERIR
jgi:catechol 2,3-dioxygenase-like lactoylglutathione lyase family enzyme